MKLKNLHKSAFLIILAISLMVASCAPKYINIHPDSLNIEMEIKPGDNVKITTLDFNEYEFTVVEVTEEAILGESEKVLVDDISTLQEMTETSQKRTLKVIGGTVLVALYGTALLIGTAVGACPY